MSEYQVRRFIGGKQIDAPPVVWRESPWYTRMSPPRVVKGRINLDECKVGGSLLVPYDGSKPRLLMYRLSERTRSKKKLTGAAFTLKSLDDGVLVTRIK